MNISEAVLRYINYRRAMGEKYVTGAKNLNRLTKFTGGEIKLENVTADIVTDYLYGGHNLANATWFIRYGTLKGFFIWANARGLCNHIPLPSKKPRPQTGFQPYIYSDEELKLLFKTALDYRVRRKKKELLYPQCIQMVLIFCYVLGLRLNESISIRIKDIDMNECVIYIRDTKFYKSRMVPFNESIKDILDSFMAWRKSERLSQDSEANLFLDIKGNPLKAKTIEGIFRRIINRLGISRSDTKQQPRIHDLRHTFAVNRLTAWYRQGADVQQLLPQLSTYMGHSHLNYTSVYLTMTDCLLGEANKRFASFAKISENNEDI